SSDVFSLIGLALTADHVTLQAHRVTLYSYDLNTTFYYFVYDPIVSAGDVILAGCVLGYTVPVYEPAVVLFADFYNNNFFLGEDVFSYDLFSSSLVAVY